MNPSESSLCIHKDWFDWNRIEETDEKMIENGGKREREKKEEKNEDEEK